MSKTSVTNTLSPVGSELASAFCPLRIGVLYDIAADQSGLCSLALKVACCCFGWAGGSGLVLARCPVGVWGSDWPCASASLLPLGVRLALCFCLGGPQVGLV